MATSFSVRRKARIVFEQIQSWLFYRLCVDSIFAMHIRLLVIRMHRTAFLSSMDPQNLYQIALSRRKTQKNRPKNSENMLLYKLKARRSTYIEAKTKIDVNLLAVYYHTVYTQTDFLISRSFFIICIHEICFITLLI